ncbi:LysR family transcriptional regulator [Telmatobacter bradus]|uniref:LysR family transcriptional regulator n=1 Tax=Telmatobacter bradus TaxID=474953 RepID=UPI003B429E16
METRQLRYFLAVAEALHFRHAAEILHLSQPSLSHQIRQIEQELGAQLFERTKRSVRLTAAGEALVPHARAILRGLSEAVHEVQRTSRGLAGEIKIGLVSTAMMGVLPHALHALQSSTPGVTVQLKESDPHEQIHGLLEEKIDVGFMHGALEEQVLSSMVVQRDVLMVAVPDALAGEECIDLGRHTDLTSIMPSPFTAFGFFNHVHRAYEMAGGQPQRFLYTNLIISSVHLVSAGMGIALIPSSFQSVKLEGVHYRPLLQTPPPAELKAVWRKDSSSLILRRFLNLLKKESLARNAAEDVAACRETPTL